MLYKWTVIDIPSVTPILARQSQRARVSAASVSTWKGLTDDTVCLSSLEEQGLEGFVVPGAQDLHNTHGFSHRVEVWSSYDLWDPQRQASPTQRSNTEAFWYTAADQLNCLRYLLDLRVWRLMREAVQVPWRYRVFSSVRFLLLYDGRNGIWTSKPFRFCFHHVKHWATSCGWLGLKHQLTN